MINSSINATVYILLIFLKKSIGFGQKCDNLHLVHTLALQICDKHIIMKAKKGVMK